MATRTLSRIVLVPAGSVFCVPTPFILFDAIFMRSSVMDMAYLVLGGAIGLSCPAGYRAADRPTPGMLRQWPY